MRPPPAGPYEPACRTRASELVRPRGVPRAQVARALGINGAPVRLWGTQAAIDPGRRARLTTAERSELTRLRRAPAVRKEAREFLKQAARVFARARVTR